MTKSYFIQLADYNIWANDMVHSWFDQLSDEQWEQPIVSSFNSLSSTALHITSAETAWLDRLNKVPKPSWLAGSFKGSKKETLDLWKKASQSIRLFLEDFDEKNMESELRFIARDGNPYAILHVHAFAHLFNHSSYHRGQIVTMLRQAGFTDVSALDMLRFFKN